MKKIINRLKRLSLLDKLLILGAIFAVFIFAYIFFRKSTYLTVTLKVGSDSIYWAGGSTVPWFSQLFYENMKERDGLGGVRAQVLKVRSYDTEPNKKSVYLTTKMKVVYNRASDQYAFRGKPVLIGSTVRLYLDKLLMDGLVTHIDGVKDSRLEKTLILETQITEENPVYLETSGIKPHIAEAIKEGEEIKDDQGNIIIKVLKKREEPATKLVTTNDGRVLVQPHPTRKTVYLTLQVKTVKIYDRYYVYDDIPVLVGSGIAINTPNITIYPEILRIVSIN